MRVFARVDRFDRFVSVLVYVPRDRYSTRVRERDRRLSRRRLQGLHHRVLSLLHRGPARPRAFHRRPHRRRDAADPDRDARTRRRRPGQDLAGRPRRDAGASRARRHRRWLRKYVGAFSAGYAETFTPARALEDIERIERLGADKPLAIDFYTETHGEHVALRAAVYRFDAPIRLSERVPVLENLGFSVIDERTYEVTPRFDDGHSHRRHAARHGARSRSTATPSTSGAAICASRTPSSPCSRARPSSDPFNRLIVAAGADWREAALLRAYAAYMRQLGLPFGPRYIADDAAAPRRHRARPARAVPPPLRSRQRRDRPRRASPASSRSGRASKSALVAVESLDEDRILRPPADADRRDRAHQLLPAGAGRRAARDDRVQARRPRRSTSCRARAPTARSGSRARASKACTCASRRSRAAASAGRTGRRISAPRCWASSRRSRSRTR